MEAVAEIPYAKARGGRQALHRQSPSNDRAAKRIGLAITRPPADDKILRAAGYTDIEPDQEPPQPMLSGKH